MIPLIVACIIVLMATVAVLVVVMRRRWTRSAQVGRSMRARGVTEFEPGDECLEVTSARW